MILGREQGLPCTNGQGFKDFLFLDWQGVASMMAVGWIKLETRSELGFRKTLWPGTRCEGAAVSASHLSCCALGRWRVRGLCLVVSVSIAACLALWGGRLWAFWPGGKAQQPAEPVGAVDENDLLKAGTNDANWLMYGRTYNAHRYSPLNQINTKNVNGLIPVWTFQTGVLDGFECSPLVIDGIMYVTTPWNHAYAIDCKTGSQLWHYQKSLPQNLALCCDAVNRGFAAWDDRLYMATLDAHLVCLDRNTGEEVWDIADHGCRRRRQRSR